MKYESLELTALRMDAELIKKTLRHNRHAFRWATDDAAEKRDTACTCIVKAQQERERNCRDWSSIAEGETNTTCRLMWFLDQRKQEILFMK